MKIIYSTVILLIMFPIVFISCQKEIEVNEEKTNDVARISKIYELDTTLPAPLDTIGLKGFIYDNSGRLTYSYELEDGFLGLDTVFKEWFFYNGASNLPYKHIENLVTVTGSIFETDTSFLFFNSDGLVVKDSSVSYVQQYPLNYFSRIFIKTGNIVSEIQKDYGDAPFSIPVKDTLSYYLQYAGVNIVNQIDTSWGEINEWILSYDNRTNPLASIFPIKYFDIGSLDYAYVFGNYLSNNIIEFKHLHKDLQANFLFSEHVRLSYEYDAKGFPVIARLQELRNSSYLKYIYKYN
jgi:hypothetical protein